MHRCMCLLMCSQVYLGVHASRCAHACAHTSVLSPSLGQILKLCPKKKSSSTYTFCKSVGLLGMQFHLFENECESQWAQRCVRGWLGEVEGCREGGGASTQGPSYQPFGAGPTLAALLKLLGAWGLVSRLLTWHHPGDPALGL